MFSMESRFSTCSLVLIQGIAVLCRTIAGRREYGTEKTEHYREGFGNN